MDFDEMAEDAFWLIFFSKACRPANRNGCFSDGMLESEDDKGSWRIADLGFAFFCGSEVLQELLRRGLVRPWPTARWGGWPSFLLHAAIVNSQALSV
jgi:hypothetical protein